MASNLPAVRGAAFTFRFYGLEDQANAGLVKTTPTLASGDCKVSKDGGSTANLATLPDEQPASSGIVRVQLSSDEMTADEVVVSFNDASGDEWYAKGFTLHTAAQTLDTTDANIDAILLDTGTDGVALAAAAITSAKYDASTAFPLAADDAGSTQVARVGADGDTLETLSDEIAVIDANVDAILLDTGTDGVVLATDAVDADALAADAVDEIWDEVIEGAYTGRQLFRLFAAALAGKASGGGTTTLTFTGVDGSTSRIIATVDANGNRTALTLDAT